MHFQTLMIAQYLDKVKYKICSRQYGIAIYTSPRLGFVYFAQLNNFLKTELLMKKKAKPTTFCKFNKYKMKQMLTG